MINDFIFNSNNFQTISGASEWRSPSNIALIKYWGKKNNQIPLNPSISITLKNCFTQTKISYQTKKVSKLEFSFLFEGENNPSFEKKLRQFFIKIEKYCPYLSNLELKIESRNSFPHSSGIASSASSYSALSLCIMDIEKELNPSIDDKFFLKKASFIARLGSGSACRSILGFFSIWGRSDFFDFSSDLYAMNYPNKIHDVYKEICDTVLIVDKEKKEVSSTMGHHLMEGHSFSNDRLNQVKISLKNLKNALERGDYDMFIKVVELEALSLHAMMMTSDPYYILLKPNTIKIINLIWKYRKENDSKICFTLDAGANIHLIYPKKEYDPIQEFIRNKLIKFCESGQFINDMIGIGPLKL
ncbi:MAG: diphosphomevalonate decarboxylase [Flavobacteriaceae bacterium]|jgi:diphosphomevalonate decarboxylase|nr:diphosphomevalonate decarboxylase [Flavobacteriaceae bacterium]MBT6447759.1 diphosphomevalonate decarboxylase [Flavobacteriaceae bacterium]MDG1831348.1 diphosphomevalonate decarboxylase [Flavobacteriaceae bacterium]